MQASSESTASAAPALATCFPGLGLRGLSQAGVFPTLKPLFSKAAMKDVFLTLTPLSPT